MAILSAALSSCVGSDRGNAADPPGADARNGFRVVGYLPDYRKFEPAMAEHLTDLIVFSAEPSLDGQLDLRRLDEVPWEALQAAKKKHNLRLILCVGGWERSTHFATVAHSAELRTKFVQSALQLCVEKKLDGIDLDWEHPKDVTEQKSYAQLLSDLNRTFKPRALSVSVTMAAWQALPREAFATVDRIQVMAYDHPGRHSTFEGAQADIKKLIDAGAPVNKLILGLPLYGRSFADNSRTLTYQQIAQRYQPAADVDEVDGIYFNGRSTIQRKVKYAQSAGLAGVMVWEIGQDASGEHSIVNALWSAKAQP